jgi:hypothetical protein
MHALRGLTVYHRLDYARMVQTVGTEAIGAAGGETCTGSPIRSVIRYQSTSSQG